MPSGADVSHVVEEHKTEEAVDYNTDCWKALDAELGFHSYKDYLKANSIDIEDFRDIWRYYRHYDLNDVARQRQRGVCCVFDISDAGELTQSLLIPDFGRDYLTPTHATTLLKTLREPPASARVRVLLFSWETRCHGKDCTPDPAWLNAIGLGLRLDPVYIDSIIDAKDGMPNEASSAFLRKERPRRSHDASNVVIAESSITIARNYLPGKGEAPPVVVILRAPVGSLGLFGILARSKFEPVKMQENKPEGGIASAWLDSYMVSVIGTLRNMRSKSFDFDTAILFALMPLLEEYKDRQSMEYRYNFEEFVKISEDKSDEGSLERLRFKARRQMRDLEQCLSDFKRFIRVQCTVECLKEKSFITLEQDVLENLNEARGLESEIRDWLQLRVGNLALEESKKSIELSNLQIEGSKRVKIATLLAFVYVPLNLATSIFGMNIQELNQNGQNVWVFIITACVTLTVTGLVWLGFEVREVLRKWREVQGARSWEEELRRSNRNEGNKYSFPARIAMLVYLLAHGHVKWAWVTNASTRVLIDDRLGRKSFHTAKGNIFGIVMYLERSTMCNYIHDHAYGDSNLGSFNASFFSTPKGGSASRPTWYRLLFRKIRPSSRPTSHRPPSASAPPLPSSPAESIISLSTRAATSVKQDSNRDGRGDSIEMRSRGNASDAVEEV